MCPWIELAISKEVKKGVESRLLVRRVGCSIVALTQKSRAFTQCLRKISQCEATNREHSIYLEGNPLLWAERLLPLISRTRANRAGVWSCLYTR